MPETVAQEPELPWHLPARSDSFTPASTRFQDENTGGSGAMVGTSLEINSYSRSSFTGDDVRPSLLFRFTAPAAGVDLGFVAGGGLGFIGTSLVNKAARVFHGRRNRLYIMLPDIKFRLYTDLSNDIAAALGTSGVGLRYAHCLGPVSLLAEVKGPLVLGYADLIAERFLWSIGAGGTLGVTF